MPVYRPLFISLSKVFPNLPSWLRYTSSRRSTPNTSAQRFEKRGHAVQRSNSSQYLSREYQDLDYESERTHHAEVVGGEGGRGDMVKLERMDGMAAKGITVDRSFEVV